MIDFKNMMQQAQDMQFKLAEMQEKFKEIIVTGEAGAGLVKITMTCAGIIKAIDIDPSIIKAEDKETLEDLIVAATNNASTAKDDKIKEETKGMMASMGLPEDAKLPF